MKAKLDAGEIRHFWKEQALRHKTDPAASWSDVRVIELEIDAIAARLEEGDRVLDIGCANGYSTVEYARRKKVRIRGIDYIPEMIGNARERLAREGSALLGTAEFEVGDVTALAEPPGSWDKAIVTRVVINLPDWERQRTALREIAQVVRPGGLLLLSEATIQGWQKLNEIRGEWGLPPIPMPDFNLYLDEDQVVRELSGEFRLLELVNFASTYYVGTRLVKPLLAKVVNAPVNVADPKSEWNRWFASLPPAGDYGTQKLFVFERKVPIS